MLAKIVICLAAVAGVATAATTKPKCQTLAQIATSTPGFETLVAAATAAGLAGQLADPKADPVTVFAPTDEAFAKVDQAVIKALLDPKNKDKLLEILTYHIVSGKVLSSQLKDDAEVPTLNEDNELEIDISKDPKGKVTVKVDDATVTKADIQGCNGVVHVIDTVLIPDDFKL